MDKKINKRILFLGAGNMAEALISGLISSNTVKREYITASDIRKERLLYLKKKYKIKIAKNNISDINKSNIIILAVKPYNFEQLLEEIKNYVQLSKVVITIAAGITTEYIEKYLKKVPVIRVMPNTPVILKAGMSVLAKGKYAKLKDLLLAKKIFDSVGQTEILDEKLFNTVTALSGSGPAYIFYISKCMQEAGENLGLSKKVSKFLVTHTISGAGKMLVESEEDADILAKKVASPGGTTERALKYFEEAKIKEIIISAISLARKRAIELTK